MDQTTKTEPSRTEIWKMFDKISPTYDLLNKLLSFGLDQYWRRAVCHHLPSQEALDLLDVATGTGDQILALFKKKEYIRQAVGIDLSPEMLQYAAAKMRDAQVSHKVQLHTASALEIPFKDATFDLVTISFGIRNVTDLEGALGEMHRTLKPGGRLIVLEFSKPSHPLLSWGHLFYLRHCIPRIAGFISKQPEAYRYLDQTIETFPTGNNFTEKMQKVGFIDCKIKPLSGGIVSLYIGNKASC